MSESRRDLSAFDIACVVVGGIVGVGIFFTPQRVAKAVDTPGQVLWAWALGGLLAGLGALVFAELSLRVPGHGGVFRYLEAAFGRTVAFLYGWANWLVIQAGALGVVGLILCDYLEVLVAPPRPWPAGGKVALAAALILAFTAVNWFGLRVGKRVQNALVVAKVLALGGLVALAWFAPPPGAPAAAPPPSGRSVLAMLAAAMLPVLFATGGWQHGSFVAGAARTPRSVSIGILVGVAVVVVTYLSVNLAYLDLLGFAGARQSPAIGAAVAEVALGPGGARLLAALVVVSAAGILNTICMAPPYVLYAMAQAGCFPAAFGRLHPRHQTPWLAVLGQGVWGVLLLGIAHLGAQAVGDGQAIDALDFVCNGVVFVDWLGYLGTALALLQLRRRAAGQPGPRVPGAGVAAFGFAAGAVLVTAGALWTFLAPSLVGAGLVLLGLLVRPAQRLPETPPGRAGSGHSR